MASGNDQWSRYRDGGAPAAPVPAAPSFGGYPGPSVPQSQGFVADGSFKKFVLYDEKYITTPSLEKHRFATSNAHEWQQSIKDYLSGRCSEIDALLEWVEMQEEPIDDSTMQGHGRLPMCVDGTSFKEISRQLWAFLNPLIAGTSMAVKFANVGRHNGLEAWRKVTEPINEDKQLVRKDLLPLVNNPKGVSALEKVEGAIDDWDTNVRLFQLAGGVVPDNEARRMSLINMLPLELSAHVTMQMGNAEVDSYEKLKKYVLKYIKIMQNLKGRARPAHLLEEQSQMPELELEEPEDPEMEELTQRLIASEDVEERMEILAVMQQRRHPSTGVSGRPAPAGVAGRTIRAAGLRSFGAATTADVAQ